MTAKVPTMATGTAINGMMAERQFCKNNSTTTATRMMASRSVLNTSLIDSLVYGVVSKATSATMPSGKLFSSSCIRAMTRSCTSRALASGI